MFNVLTVLFPCLYRSRSIILFITKQNQSITNHWVCVARVHWVTASCAESGRLATTEYIYGAGGSFPPSFLQPLPFLLHSAFSFLLLADFLSFFCSIFPPSFCLICTFFSFSIILLHSDKGDLYSIL